ncbi:hypothetical protein HU200_031957 [Digitaria exilis]|uniref:Uncharacterized protein n=1 Tax=Digitaria exilis TaxID=1010633 RepID=A0A835EPW4_9POAL|nr:hypothetical protein HU200_031957 [Digitaria exilis]
MMPMDAAAKNVCPTRSSSPPHDPGLPASPGISSLPPSPPRTSPPPAPPLSPRSLTPPRRRSRSAAAPIGHAPRSNPVEDGGWADRGSTQRVQRKEGGKTGGLVEGGDGNFRRRLLLLLRPRAGATAAEGWCDADARGRGPGWNGSQTQSVSQTATRPGETRGEMEWGRKRRGRGLPKPPKHSLDIQPPAAGRDEDASAAHNYTVGDRRAGRCRIGVTDDATLVAGARPLSPARRVGCSALSPSDAIGSPLRISQRPGTADRELMASYFVLNNGAKIPSVGLGTWQADPGLVGDAVYAAVKAHRLRSSIQQRKRGDFFVTSALSVERMVSQREIGMNIAALQVGLALKKVLDEGIVKREDLFITSKLWSVSPILWFRKLNK